MGLAPERRGDLRRGEIKIEGLGKRYWFRSDAPKEEDDDEQDTDDADDDEEEGMAAVVASTSVPGLRCGPCAISFATSNPANASRS